jgi:hypothetical protein
MPDNAHVYRFPERARLRVVGIGSPGEITLARSFLWEKVLRVQSCNERGPRLFRTCTERTVVWIGRRVACYADVHELRLLSEEIDYLTDKVAPNTESR